MVQCPNKQSEQCNQWNKYSASVPNYCCLWTCLRRAQGVDGAGAKGVDGAGVKGVYSQGGIYVQISVYQNLSQKYR